MSQSDTSTFKPCILIPVYNHKQALDYMLSQLNNFGLPVIFVDDGSAEEYAICMNSLKSKYTNVLLVTHKENQGKGAAIKTGLAMARGEGFTHALQIDADGQHCLADIQIFLCNAEQNPRALIAGYPKYDDTIPKHRFYARYLTHVWVWINTLSTHIIDSMCGFRVYPVAQSCDLLESSTMGNRMEFDGEFIVRWYWIGHKLVQIPTRVTYPENGTSHFRLFRDNVLISFMHARLFFMMLTQISSLLKIRKNNTG